MKMISFKLPKHLVELVNQEAKRRGVTKSEVMRDALQRSLFREKKKGRVSCLDLISHLVGTAKNAPRDLSTNPKYMEGYGE